MGTVPQAASRCLRRVVITSTGRARACPREGASEQGRARARMARWVAQKLLLKRVVVAPAREGEQTPAWRIMLSDAGAYADRLCFACVRMACVCVTCVCVA